MRIPGYDHLAAFNCPDCRARLSQLQDDEICRIIYCRRHEAFARANFVGVQMAENLARELMR